MLFCLSFTLIMLLSVSFLHFGQYKGTFFSVVPLRIFMQSHLCFNVFECDETTAQFQL